VFEFPLDGDATVLGLDLRLALRAGHESSALEIDFGGGIVAVIDGFSGARYMDID